MLLLGWPAGARAAELKAVSAAQFRADVARLQGVVAACKASAAACDPAQVGDDERVGDVAKSGFAMHWQWLRDSLEQARKAKGDRAAAVGEASARLDEMAQESAAPDAARQQGFAQARTTANAVLAQAEFDAADAPTWWDRQKAKLWAWLAQALSGVGRLGSAAPWLGTLLEWLLFAGAAVGLLFFLLRNVARHRLRVAMGAGAARAATQWDREPGDWAKWAEEHAAAGEWREAVHCLYWAAIVLLESRRAWRHNPARTPREYVRLLRAGSPQQAALRGLTRTFERVWYGLRTPEAEEYARARRLYEQLASGADSPAATGTAVAEVA